jgi:hypothetical protein
MSNSIRVIQYGLGPIGSAAARLVVERAGLELVGGVDIAPQKVGQDVGTVIGLDHPLGFPVDSSLANTLARTPADVVVHTTSSYFDLFKDQIIEILDAGLDIVSTSEELSFPWPDHAAVAAEIDACARRAGKTVLGTGVNPGFLMDFLPLTLTAICKQVDHISVTRVINASARRGPFQAKIGSAMTPQAFQAKMDEGRMGHVGLPQSMAMVFDTMGWVLERFESSVEPVIATEPVTTPFFSVQPGQVKGLQQVAHGYAPEGERMLLTFIAALAMENDGDHIEISGKPNLSVKLQGTNGDIATISIAVNAIRRVRDAAPGLLTMRDLPIVTSW